MRIAIAGIGGVGGYYGGKLAFKYGSSGEHEIIFIARGENLKAIRENGLQLDTQQEGSFKAFPSIATDKSSEAGPFDVVLFCVKSYGLEAAAAMINESIREHTVVIPLLNGVDIVDRLRKVLTRGIVLNGCVYISSRIEGPGKINQVGGSCQLIFGPDGGSIESYKQIQDAFVAAGIKSELTADSALHVWTKYIFISPLAGMTSLLMKPFGAIMEDEGLQGLLRGLIKETEVIARRKGINLPENIVNVTLGKVTAFPYETKTSIQLDFEKGRHTELEIFTGYIVRAGRELGVPTPLHDDIYERLKNRS